MRYQHVHYHGWYRVIGILFVFVFTTLLVVTIWFTLTQDSAHYIGNLIAQDLKRLRAIFDTIDQAAGIDDFAQQNNPINFLNIKQGGFIGSNVGALYLKDPSKWQGPYLLENPSIKGIDYAVVRAAQGYYIMPGLGVTLPNGKVMGTDIVITQDTSVEPLLEDPAYFNYRGQRLAIALRGPVAPEKEYILMPEDQED